MTRNSQRHTENVEAKHRLHACESQASEMRKGGVPFPGILATPLSRALDWSSTQGCHNCCMGA
eukprot:CAMPEP_0203986182 /NCGR_PEP_ID=MMETSP0360-20130528/5838_1 /ASSEMBLY_ACC=CAM_ASM_000342 /TAXON_ID=268821 /ORGANISM="Scrippsiella Hangoei, Strain SHTV-5" /LENGTH=62 /DNA_ID=CAMNT_0050925579 /DNA_START=20 /DNA_END=203 /DNA_ORIENTATION=-